MRQGAAPECVPELVGPARPRLADDVDRVGSDAPRLGPFEQEARDALVEELIRWRGRAEEIVVEVAASDRVEDRRAGCPIREVAPLDQKRTLGLRVQAAHLSEQLAARRPAEPLSRQHEGHLLPGSGTIFEQAERLLRRPDAGHAIPARIPVEQLLLDGLKGRRVLLDAEDHGIRHAVGIVRSPLAPPSGNGVGDR